MILKRKKKKKRSKLPSTKSLWDKAWSLQSRFIRRSAADFAGYAPCYTCGKVYPWNDGLQAGHFIHQSYDFDVRNIKPQCSYCNHHGHGKPLEFYLHLVAEYGKRTANDLKNRAHWNNYTRKDLNEIIEHYQLQELAEGAPIC